VILDDPQTDESSGSPVQTRKRLSILRKGILKLAGHSKGFSIVCNATVIQRGDMIEQLLADPSWQGERVKMVEKWADLHDEWMGEYATIRRAFDKEDAKAQLAAHIKSTEYYRQRFDAMNAGAVVYWHECYNRLPVEEGGELSAVQHAYNALIDDGPEVFASEYQQEPLQEDTAENGIEKDSVLARTIEVPRWIVPRGLDTLTAFVDVQQAALYWAVVAWGHQFRGHVVAYGAYPDQGRSYFTLRDVKRTLQAAAGTEDVAASIHAGLEALTAELLEREVSREDDDAVLRVGQLFIDANWAQYQGVVRDFARRSKWGPRVLPTHGRYVGASGRTISDKAPDKGERIGWKWRTSTIGRQRHVEFDTNGWKSFVAARIRLPVGDSQGLTVHAGQHDMLADQLAAEKPERVVHKATQREVDQWHKIPGRDNHLLDCLVGAAVAASFSGVSAVGVESRPARPERKRITAEEMAAKRAELLARMGRA
jgi:phage terminase large subunit GpA-like protein